jgi:pimeloyl-ACP methyl ester carboxylesterase
MLPFVTRSCIACNLAHRATHSVRRAQAPRALINFVKAYLLIGVRIGLIYAAVCVVLYLIQDRLLYYPSEELARPGARVQRLTLGDATLKIWELHPEARDALLYFGGNAERVGDNLPEFDAAFADRALYLVNYRGYDGSTGRPSEAALIADAERIFDWVAARHPHIAVIGRSLGSAVAVALASTRPVERLILVTPFDSIARVAADHFWWLPARWLVRDRYNSLSRMAHVAAPVLVVIAERDEVVARARTEALVAAIPPVNRHRLVFPGATHNDIGVFPEYLPSLKQFLGVPATPQVRRTTPT